MVSKSEITEKALTLFDEGYACSQSVLLAFADRFQLDKQTATLIASTFGGGMGRLRRTCGAITGGFMVIGLAAGNDDPGDMDIKLHAYKLVRELNKRVEEIHGTTLCKELLKKHATDAQVEERKHHKIICRQVVADSAGSLYDILLKEGIIK